MKKILVIEDDEGVLEPLESYITDEMTDYAFFKALTGAEGLRILEKEKPDLLVLDMKLDPFMDGIEVLRRIRSRLPRMAVVVFTGFVDPNMETEARKMGVDTYLEKPVNLLEFREVVDKVMARRQESE